MRRANRGISVIAIASIVVLYLPLVAVMSLSFNSTRNGQSWGHFTTQWYQKILIAEAPENATKLELQDAQMAREIRRAAKNSAIVAFSSTIVATLVGTLLAIGLSRLPVGRWGRTAADVMINLPTVTPDILLAAALVVAYGIFRTVVPGIFDPGLTTLTIGHVTFQVSFVAVVVGARLKAIGSEQFEAARDLYAGTWSIWQRVILPQLAPGIVGGALLAFTLSLDDFVVSFFISGPSSTTLPVLIYASVKRGVTPQIHALSTLIVALTMIAIVGMALINRPRPAKE
jgi:spermidine/putrescine transport system permease protein